MNELEKSIIYRFKHGDKKAFEYIFKLYYPQLCFFAQSILLVKETAEDLVKDFFLSLWDNREKLKINISLKSYLLQSVKNRCFNYIRDNKKIVNQISEDEQLELLCKPIDSYILENIITKEMKTVLDKSIEELPEQRRMIFIMSRNEGLSHNEIAQKLNISPNTVKVQIFKALTYIRTSLEKFF